MFDKQVFANRLKELREKTSLNQKECAEKLNISRGSISFYENGERLPDIETIYNMAKFFNVSADYLVGLIYVKTTDKDDKYDIKSVFENHLRVLENAAKKQCSGQDLKAITEAMKITAHSIEYFDSGYSHN